MAKIAQFSGVPHTATERQYTKIDWSQVAKLNAENGNAPVELERETDFTAKRAVSVVVQAKGWAKKNGYEVAFEIPNENAVRILLTKLPEAAPTDAASAVAEPVPVA